MSPFALDQAQLQALLAQAGLDPNTQITIEQVDPNQQQGQQQLATLCTSPGGTQYTVLTQGPAQQQFILQTTTTEPTATQIQVQQAQPQSQPIQIQPQPIAPKEDSTSPPPKRRAFAVKSTTAASRIDQFDDINANERPRRKIFATKSTVSAMSKIFQSKRNNFLWQIIAFLFLDDDMVHDEEGIIGTRAYNRNVTRK